MNVDLILYLRILGNDDESLMIDIDKKYGISIAIGKGPDPTSENYYEWVRQLNQIVIVLLEKAKEKLLEENKTPIFDCKMEDEESNSENDKKDM